MPSYIIRDLPEDLWKRVKARAERDAWPLRKLFLQLLEDFASERITPGGLPDERRLLIVKLHDGDRVLPIPGAVSVDELQDWVLARDATGHLVARFGARDVQSWWFELAPPP